MKAKIFAYALLALILASIHLAEAQQAKKVHRIGYLSIGTQSPAAYNREAFLDGMRQLGYVENKNLLIEYRYAEGRSERLANLAADLVRLKVDVIIAAGTQATSIAKNATSTIPIVTPSSSDLFSKGVAETLASTWGECHGYFNDGRRVEW